MMKITKKKWAVSMAAAMAVSMACMFTACSKPQGQAHPSSQASQSQQESSTQVSAGQGKESQEGSQATSAPAPVDASSQALQDGGEFKIITGAIQSVTSNFSNVTIVADGKTLQFDIQQADVETSYELAPNTDITLAYKGKIQGTDTKGVTVALVIDAQKDAQVKTMEGVVAAQAMSTFTIKKDDGSQVTFLKNNCEGLDSGALGQPNDDQNGTGARVIVTYVGANYDMGAVQEKGDNMYFPLKVEGAK